MNIDDKNYVHTLLPRTADEFKKMLKAVAGNTMDVNISDIMVSGHRCVFVASEGMISTQALSHYLRRGVYAAFFGLCNNFYRRS